MNNLEALRVVKAKAMSQLLELVASDWPDPYSYADCLAVIQLQLLRVVAACLSQLYWRPRWSHSIWLTRAASLRHY